MPGRLNREKSTNHQKRTRAATSTNWRAIAAALVKSEFSDDQTSANNLGILLRRVSASSTRQIENLVGELQTLGKKLHSDGDRIQRDIEEYAELNQQVIQLTAIIFDSVKKLPEVRKS